MPKRTNRGQDVVGLLRRLLAESGGQIEESAMLTDAVTGDQREVDVVWSGVIQDIRVTVSFEVIDWSRPANVQWVEQQVAKHAHLPTHRLVLVSWSGFSAPARRKALTTPTVVLVDLHEQASEPRHLRFLETALTPREVKLHVQRPDGVDQHVSIQPDHQLFSQDGTFKAPAIVLTQEILYHSEIMKQALAQAAKHDTPGELKSFVVSGALPLGYSWLQWEATGELHAVVGIEIQGDAHVTDKALDLEYRTFIEGLFGFASVSTSQGTVLLVSTHDADKNFTGVAGRMGETGDRIDVRLWDGPNK